MTITNFLYYQCDDTRLIGNLESIQSRNEYLTKVNEIKIHDMSQ